LFRYGKHILQLLIYKKKLLREILLHNLFRIWQHVCQLHVLNTYVNSCPPVCSQWHCCRHNLPASIHYSRKSSRISSLLITVYKSAYFRSFQVLKITTIAIINFSY